MFWKTKGPQWKLDDKTKIQWSFRKALKPTDDLAFPPHLVTDVPLYFSVGVLEGNCRLRKW